MVVGGMTLVFEHLLIVRGEYRLADGQTLFGILGEDQRKR